MFGFWTDIMQPLVWKWETFLFGFWRSSGLGRSDFGRWLYFPCFPSFMIPLVNIRKYAFSIITSTPYQHSHPHWHVMFAFTKLGWIRVFSTCFKPNQILEFCFLKWIQTTQKIDNLNCKMRQNEKHQNHFIGISLDQPKKSK